MTLALNVAAMLIAFVALVAMIDLGVTWVGELAGYQGDDAWKLEKAFGVVFAPFAWLMGIPGDECRTAGGMLGTKAIVNEVLACYGGDPAHVHLAALDTSAFFDFWTAH